jgi:CO/xanthine dehydrogenase Mo-binding subunit
MNAPIQNPRRSFLKKSSGLIIGFSWMPSLLAQNAAIVLPGDLPNNPNIDSWLSVDPRGLIIIYAGKVEFGQGITTALKQIAADEMDVNISRIVMVPTTTGLSPNEGVTSGSQSVEYGGLALRYACAQARGTLLEKAAKQFDVAQSSLTIKDGVISSANGKSVEYWKLVEPELLKQRANLKYKPKGASERTYIGQSFPRVDIPAKVSGGVAYVQDMRIPGMLHARVVRPPAPRATLKSINENLITGLPGVVGLVRNGSFLAVVAKREEQAIRAMEEAKKVAQWELANDLPTSTGSWLNTMKSLKSIDTEHGVKTASTSAAVKTIEQQYTKPFTAHGSIGPSCAIAVMNSGVLKIYTHSQGMYPLRTDIVKALGMPTENVVCMHVEGSGMYGQSGADDVALDAALVAVKFPEQAIKMQWMREDEFKWEPYGSAMSMKIKASIDNSGKIVDWQYDLWSNTHSTRPGEKTGNNLVSSWYMDKPQTRSPVTNIPLPAGGSHRNALPLYSFPNQKVTNHLIEEMPIRVSALRTLGAYANVFAIESMMDELAQAAKIDPVEFRLNHLENQRAKDVITKAASMAKWNKNSPLKSKKGDKLLGRGVGFAQYKNLQAYCAVIADVEVDTKTGKVRVLHMYSAADAGLIINPDGFKNQIEGGLVQTASWTLYEALAFDKNSLLASSWAEYPILRFEDMPNVSVELIDRPNEKSVGVGEGSQGPGGAAIANAVANAIGKRIYDLPLTPNKIKPLIA